MYFSAPHRVDFRALVRDLAARLMCCLKHEHPLYQDFKKKAPRPGSPVDTPEGPGTVVAHSVPSGSVVVKPSADGSTCACSVASVCGSRKAYESTHGVS